MTETKAVVLPQKNILITLVKMLLKEHLGGTKKDAKSTWFSLIYFALAAVAITAIVYGVLWLGAFLRILTLAPGFITPTLLVFFFSLLFLFSLGTLAINLAKNLFLSPDNLVLMTFPAKPNIIFLAKLIVFYVLELRKTFLFLVPIFLGYAIYNGFHWGFYLSIIPTFLVISLFLVLLGALLSVPTMWIVSVINKYPIIQTILFIIMLGLMAGFAFYLISLVPSQVNVQESIQNLYIPLNNFLRSWSQVFVPFVWLNQMIIGSYTFMGHQLVTWQGTVTFIVVLVLVVILAIMIWFTIRNFYFRQIAKSHEFQYKKGKVETKPNEKHHRLGSSLRIEMLLNLRVPSTFISNFIFIFLMPFAILLLNTWFAAMDTRLEGVHISIAFNVLIMLILLLPNNSYAASIVSAEGDAAYLEKAKPLSFAYMIYSRIAINYVVSLIAIITTTILMLSIGAIPNDAIWYMTILVIVVHTAHLLWSVDLDLMNPQYELYHDREKTSANINEIKSVIIAFVIAFVVFGFVFLVLFQRNTNPWERLVIGALLFLGLRIFLNRLRLKVFYKVEVTK